MVPQFIRSAADFARLVTIGTTTESLVLEFKSEVNFSDPKEPKDSCRDIAQFANTDGGCLLIGVEEELDPTTNLKKARGVRSVGKPDELISRLEQGIANHLVPATFSIEMVPVQTTSGIVVALNIPACQHAVYLWSRQEETFEVIRRTNYGRARMNPNELERHVMNGSRAARIRIEEIIANAPQSPVELVGGLFEDDIVGNRKAMAPDSPARIGQVGEMAFELKIPIKQKVRVLQVPYEALTAAWLAPAGGIMIMLNVRAVFTAFGTMTLIPFAG